ncbi:unnamed protein product [Adineta steineri]|uniref:Apple domain-containing protein n=1 Tax=Adineta steineri TaxID=433720 RepID=A0A815S449_9BILA|nr:unnamed protein product [Adineta steineri]
MASKGICLWLVFMIITQSVGEDMRSVQMSVMRGWKFHCATIPCLPLASIITSTIIKCQMACLAQIYCRAASFHQSTSNCELFSDMSNEIANMQTDTDITTMIVIAGTRSPPVCTWSQTATTIFGSQAGTSGSSLSLLNSPTGMYYDQPNNRLIVGDLENVRILQISLNSSPSVATVIAGSNGQGCNMNQFTANIGVGLDSSGNLYGADLHCNQVVRFPSNSNSATSGTLLGSIAAPALIFINQLTNDIYVVGNSNNAIYKFVGGSGSPVVVAGGNGNGNALNQLNGPNGVYYDYLYTNALYVADLSNNRVMKFPSGSTSSTYGTVVAGGNGAGNGTNQLNGPRSIVVDSGGTLYVLDRNNNRVQRWLPNATNGTTIAGGTQGTGSNQLYWPESLIFDSYYNLLVVDRYNNRIQRFNLTSC